MTIDDLLNEPLASVADNGFSARVMARVRAKERRNILAVAAAAAVCAVLALLFLPVHAIGVEMNSALIQIARSAAASVAVAASILTLLVEREFIHL
jgi:protein-S-isoprenylcysteine O-methyltransferase Ste14